MDMKSMFTEVEDPATIQVGDIVYWPAEKGKVMHLHGSTSTMRGLGFSVGNRTNGTTYGAIQMFQCRPEQAHLFVVSDIVKTGKRRTEQDARYQSLFMNARQGVKAQETDPVTIFQVHPLPMEFPEVVPDNFEIYSLVYEQTPPYNWTVDLLDDMDVDNPRSRNLVFQHIPACDAQQALKSVCDHFGNKIYHHWFQESSSSHCDNDQLFSELADEACSIRVSADKILRGTDPLDYRGRSSCARVPVEVITNGAKYGVKVLRPTAEFQRAYAKKLLVYVIRRTRAQRQVLRDNVKGFLMDLRKDIIESGTQDKQLMKFEATLEDKPSRKLYGELMELIAKGPSK